MNRQRALALVRFARTEEGALAVAILAVLVAGIVAAVMLPRPGSDLAFSREEGSLIAPPSESEFTDLLAAPTDPSDAIGATEPEPGSGGSGNGGAPPAPAPSPGRPPAPPPPPPPDHGLLRDIPIPPLPPLRGPR